MKLLMDWVKRVTVGGLIFIAFLVIVGLVIRPQINAHVEEEPSTPNYEARFIIQCDECWETEELEDVRAVLRYFIEMPWEGDVKISLLEARRIHGEVTTSVTGTQVLPFDLLGSQ